MASTDLVAGDATNNATYTGGNDGTMKLRVGPNGAKVDGIAIDASGNTTFLKPTKLATSAVVSMVRVATYNGAGSTNTRIKRFTTTITNTGTDITYADSATLGASFTINTAGIYTISYCLDWNTAGTGGISLNSTELSVDLGSITNTNNRLVICGNSSSLPSIAQWSGYLSVGDVIRPHADGTAAANANRHSFTIVKVA